MPGNAQPLVSSVKVVNDDGTPTDYFIRWAQERQIDITAGITAAQAQQLIDDWAAARDIIAGTALNGGGNLSSDVTIDHADSAVTPNTYGDATHVAQITVDQQGHVTAVANVPVSGGGGGGAWYFNPPLAASFAKQSGDATLPILTDDAQVGLLVQGNTPVGGDLCRMAYRTLTSKTLDWSIVVRMNWLQIPDNFASMGIRIRDSISGKLYGYGFRNGDAIQLNRAGFTNLAGGFIGETNSSYRGTVNWLKVDRVGVNLIYYASADGKLWHKYLTETVAGFFPNNPDQIGFGVNYNRTGVDQTLEYSIDYFSLTGPAV